MSLFIYPIVIFFIFLSGYLPDSNKSVIAIKVDSAIYDTKTISIYSGSKVIYFLLPDSLKNKPEYYYKLEPFDREWTKTEHEFFRYTNLPGGNYTFIVDTDDDHPGGTTKLVFEIRRAFYEEWWFWLFIISSIVGVAVLVIYFWFLYDFRQKMKVEDIRRKIAADLHDEVGSNLSSMNFSVEVLKKKLGTSAKDVNDILNKITSNSKETGALISDTVWALNPQNDAFDKLIDRMKSFTHDALSILNIQYTFEVIGEGPADSLSIDQKRTIYLIYKEAINNIIKHADAHQVEIKLSNTIQGLEINIADDGIGFDLNEIHEGNGLKNFKMRSEDETIQVKVDSQLDKGTTISILARYFYIPGISKN